MIKFSTKNKDRFLEIISRGSCDDLKQLRDYILALRNIPLSSGQTRVLVDESRLEYKLQTVEIFNSGRFVSFLEPKPSKIAVLSRLDGFGDAKFWETVAVNRGVAVRVFKDKGSAKQWILN